jgi:hypothetical protein
VPFCRTPGNGVARQVTSERLPRTWRRRAPLRRQPRSGPTRRGPRRSWTDGTWANAGRRLACHRRTGHWATAGRRGLVRWRQAASPPNKPASGQRHPRRTRRAVPVSKTKVTVSKANRRARLTRIAPRHGKPRQRPAWTRRPATEAVYVLHFSYTRRLLTSNLRQSTASGST